MTNHAQVLLYLACNPDARMSDVAAGAQITERAAYRIVADLQEAGYVTRTKQGRRNHYRVNAELPIEDPVVDEVRVADLLGLLPGGATQAHALILPRRVRSRNKIQEHRRPRDPIPAEG